MARVKCFSGFLRKLKVLPWLGKALFCSTMTVTCQRRLGQLYKAGLEVGACVYVYVYIQVYIYTYICIYMCVYVCNVCMCICIYEGTCIQA